MTDDDAIILRLARIEQLLELHDKALRLEASRQQVAELRLIRITELLERLVERENYDP